MRCSLNLQLRSAHEKPQQPNRFDSPIDPDLRFMCQTTSIDFLAAQNFDFNKLFRDGISYLRPCDEERIKESICEKQQLRKSNMTPGGGSMGTNGAPFIVPEDQKGVWSLSE